ncbi:MAG TPA: tryptophan 7-halogenase, partial [Povalibacter sp.]
MSTDSVSNIVIVGRDAPAWLAACVMQSALGPAGVNVTVVELPSALRVHDVYATLPALEALHHRLRIDEATLLGSTGGAFSLGQNFADTSGATPSFFHAYGSYGAPIDNKAFLPYWLMARSFGLQVALDDFSLTAAAAKHGRMLIPDTATATYGRTDYGYHLPAIEYARVLKNAALRRGVNVHTAHAVGALLDPDDGSVVALQAAGGLRVAGEFFIDATGTESWLLGSVLGVQRDSWRQSFPVDRQLVSSGDRLAIIPPYADV